MLFRTLTILSLLLFGLNALAQETGEPTEQAVNPNAAYLTKSFTLLQASLGALEVAHERQIGKTPYTVQGVFGIGANPLASFSILPISVNRNRSTNAYASLEGRYYYNLAKRSDKGKKVAYNSGCFLGLRTRLAGPFSVTNEEGITSRVNSRLTVSPRWGLRTALGERFSFEFAIGLPTRINPITTGGFNVHSSFETLWRFAYRL